MDNFRERFQEFFINNGRHLSDAIFKGFEKNCIICAFYIKKNFLCTLFRLIFIDFQNVGVISAALCIMLQSSTCLEQYYAHHQEVKLYLYSIWYHHSL